MGRLERRLDGLEALDRERATTEIRQAWDRLSDEELALILAPFHFGREPTPQEASAEAALREVASEELIARSIGYREGLSDEEISRRLGDVVDPVVKRRRAQILNRMTRHG